MIISDRPSWLRIVLTLRGSSLSKTWPRLLLTTLLSVVVTALYTHYEAFHFDLTVTPFSLIGLALGIFLGFRNNTSYDRFWEGRKLWGRLVNATRSLTRQVLTLIGPRQPKAPPEELEAVRKRLVYRTIAYVHALRLHLRDQRATDDLAHFLGSDELQALERELNRPIALLQGTGDQLRALWDSGWIDTMHLPVLEASLTDLADIQGGCERIKSTPIPFSYTVLIHRIVAVYCVTLPFGIVSTVGVFTPLVVMMVAYAFFGLDTVGDEIEDPFGEDPNDLPLSALSRMIEVNLRQRLGETDLPPLHKPVDGILR